MNAGLKYEDLQPQFSVLKPTAECDRNGDYYDSAGNVRGKECPISFALIRKSGPRLTRHTLLDESPSIKMSDGYCYDKKAFISYLKEKLRKGISPNAIKSPMTNVPYGIDELNEFQNAGLINFENYLKLNRELRFIGRDIFDELIRPGFYYSFDNTDNNEIAQDMDNMYHANEYLHTLGAPEPVEYAKLLVIEGYLDLFNNNIPRNFRILMNFYTVDKLFMPFIRMNKSFSYYRNDSNEIRYGHDFELIWENHPFFGRRFRDIFEKISTSCWRPTVFSGEMSLRSGKRIEHSKELYPNCNTDSTKTQRWIQLIDTLRQDKHIYEMGNRIGGKRRPKNYHKTKRINKRRNKKTRGHRKN